MWSQNHPTMPHRVSVENGNATGISIVDQKEWIALFYSLFYHICSGFVTITLFNYITSVMAYFICFSTSDNYIVYCISIRFTSRFSSCHLSCVHHTSTKLLSKVVQHLDRF